MTAARGARQCTGPIPDARTRSAAGSTGSAGGWDGGDAILSALEGPGCRRSRRGRRVTWHSRSLNAKSRSCPASRRAGPRPATWCSGASSDTPALEPPRPRSCSAAGPLRRFPGASKERPGDALNHSCPSLVPLPPWASLSLHFSPASSERSRCFRKKQIGCCWQDDYSV